MILIFSIFLTTLFAISHEKYIDLLPDEKKQEFLNKIAKRIIESVESNGTNIKSREMTDNQSNEPKSYVQSAMEQDTAAFEPQGTDEDYRSTEDDNKSKENDDSVENLGVEPLQLRDDDSDKFDSSDGLAVTGIRRRSFDEIPQDNFTDNSKSDNVTEETLPLETESVTSDVNTDETTEASHIENSNKKEGNLNYQGAFTINSEMELHKPNRVEASSKNQDLKTENKANPPSTALENNLQDETLGESILPLALATSSTEEVKNVPTKTTTGSKIQILEDDSATDSNTIYLITQGNDYLVNNVETNATESYIIDSSDDTRTSSNAAQGPEFESEGHVSENYSTVNSSEPSSKVTKSYKQEGSALIDESTIDSGIDMTSNKSKTQVTLRSEFESDVPENYSTVNDFKSSSKATKFYTRDSSDSALTDESTIDAVIDTKSEENAIQLTQEPDFESAVYVPEKYFTVNNIESSSKANEFYTQDSFDDALTDEITIDSITNTMTNESAINMSKGPEFKSKVHALENYTTDNNSESTLKTTESYTQDNNASPLTGESTTDSIIDTTTNESAIQGIQDHEFETEVHVSKNDSTVNDLKSSLKATEFYKEDSSDSALIYESTIDAVIDTKSEENAIQLTQEPDIESAVYVPQKYSTVNNIESSSKANEFSIQDSIDDVQTDESTIDAVAYTTTNENAIQLTQESKLESKVNAPVKYSSLNNSELNSKATKYYKPDLTDEIPIDAEMDTKSNESAIQMTQEPEFESEVNITKNYFKGNNSESNIKSTDSYMQDNSASPLTGENTTDSVIDTATNESAIQVTQDHEFKTEAQVPKNDSTVNDFEFSSKTTESYTQDSSVSALTYKNTIDATTDTMTKGSEFESEVHALENYTTDNNSESSSKATESNTQDNSASPLTGENTIDSVIDTTTNDNAIQVTQDPEFETEVHEPENNVNDFESSSKATESYIKDNNDSALTDERTIDALIETISNESIDLSTTDNVQLFTTMIQNTEENNSTITENHFAEEPLETITEKNAFIPTLITTNIEEEQSTKELEEITLSNTIKQPESDLLASYIASRALHNIKQELENKKVGKFFGNDIETISKQDTLMNHYQVYEISWPISRHNQPFRRSQEPIKDQTYFVPVYKYSPNYAYYNPNNRLGPNEVEEISIELDTPNLREENNKIFDKAEPSEFILQLNNELRKFIKQRKKKPTITRNRKPFWLQGGIRIAKKSSDVPPEHVPSNPSQPSDNCESNENCETTTIATFGEGVNENIEENKDKKDNIKNKKKGTTVAEILSVIGEKDIFDTLEKLLPLNIPLMRSKAESKVSIYMNVLRDLILDDSKALKQYDWLTTTVQIQSALKKILKLIKCMQSEPIHPADLQILKYMVFLHNFSLEIKEDNEAGNKSRKKVKLLPRNKKKRNNKLLKKKGSINRAWLYLRTLLPDLFEGDGLSQLYEFLIDVQDELFDLHEVIKHIADVTKFDRQNWYGNLKQLYLSADEKHLRELLLHISMSRLIDLVEHSCKQGLDNEFIQFVETNKKDAAKILEEIIFIEDIVNESKVNMK